MNDKKAGMNPINDIVETKRIKKSNVLFDI